MLDEEKILSVIITLKDIILGFFHKGSVYLTNLSVHQINLLGFNSCLLDYMRAHYCIWGTTRVPFKTLSRK